MAYHSYVKFVNDNFVVCLQIRDFVKEVQVELSKPGFNSFGLGDCKAPKVLGDIVESIAGSIFLDSGRDTAVVWKVSFPSTTHPPFLSPHFSLAYDHIADIEFLVLNPPSS